MNLSLAYLEWEQQTLQKGRAGGQQKGQQIEARKVLLRLLTHKFTPLGAQVVSQIQAIADIEKLEQLAEVLIDVPNLQSFLQNI